MKYETMKDRLEDVASIQAKYQVLQSQYEALSALVKDSDTSNAVQVMVRQTSLHIMLVIIYYKIVLDTTWYL